MDWQWIWGTVLSVAGIAVTVVIFRKTYPKRRLEYSVSSRRLVQSAPGAKLEIKVSGVEVLDPYLVWFRLTSTSRADIPSSAFDGGRPLSIRVQPGGALLLNAQATGGFHTTGRTGDGWKWAEFKVQPELLSKGSRLTLDFISSGEPQVIVDSPLIDIAVKDVTWKKTRGQVAWISYLLVIFTVTFSYGMLTLLKGDGPQELGEWIMPAISLVVAAAAAIPLVHKGLQYADRTFP